MSGNQWGPQGPQYQQPAWGPQFGPGPYGVQPGGPPKRKSHTGLVLGLVAAGIVVLGGAAAAGLAARRHDAPRVSLPLPPATYYRPTVPATVAHEYGHHLQQLTGIMTAFGSLRWSAPTEAAGLEMNRRMELQASCLGNVFLGANRRSYPISGRAFQAWRWVTEGSGDENNPPGIPNDHGKRKSHAYWSKSGFTNRSTAACRTFLASSSMVG